MKAIVPPFTERRSSFLEPPMQSPFQSVVVETRDDMRNWPQPPLNFNTRRDIASLGVSP
jgi:hypothetical protein